MIEGSTPSDLLRWIFNIYTFNVICIRVCIYVYNRRVNKQPLSSPSKSVPLVCFKPSYRHCGGKGDGALLRYQEEGFLDFTTICWELLTIMILVPEAPLAAQPKSAEGRIAGSPLRRLEGASP